MVESIMPDAEQEPIPGNILEAMLEVWDQTKGQHSVPIVGRSMFPIIRNGDQVLVMHGSAGVRRGDVVVFRYRDGLIAHRVLRIYKGDNGLTLITKGDNVSYFDPPVNSNAIVGRVLAIKRGNRNTSLDTAIWRICGWLIAIGTLASAKVYRCGQNLKQRLLTNRPCRLTVFICRGMQVLFLHVRRVIFIAFSRWQ